MLPYPDPTDAQQIHIHLLLEASMNGEGVRIGRGEGNLFYRHAIQKKGNLDIISPNQTYRELV